MARNSSLVGREWVTSEQKRAFDILVAGLFAPIAVPIGATALTASRLMDGPHPLFQQERVGRNGMPFIMRKIRSMEPAEPSQDIHRTDARVTRLGKLIRPSAIDEIPQIWNILNGTMSAVGLRAYPQATIDGLEASLPRPLFEEWLDVYMTSRPGILSTYHIGTRYGVDPEGENIKKAMMDIYDFKNASLSYDLGIIRYAAETGWFLARRNKTGVK